jgi:acyl carrier protein
MGLNGNNILIKEDILMTENEKLRLLEEMLEEDEGTLEMDMLLSDVSGWDSIAVISLIALLDSKFGKSISSQEIKSLKKVKDIINLMN